MGIYKANDEIRKGFWEDGIRISWATDGKWILTIIYNFRLNLITKKKKINLILYIK